MSFLLEALRKSENQKHRGQVPTIHSSNSLEYRQRRVLKPAPLLLLILPVILVLLWFGWQRLTTDPGPQGTPVNVPVQGTGVEDAAVSVEGRSDPAAEPGLPDIPSYPVTSNRSQSERTPVENFTVEQNDDNTSMIIEIGEPAGNKPEIAPRRGPENMSMSTMAMPGDEAPAPGMVDTTDNARPVTESDEPVPAEYHDRQLSAISYWQLPESVRQELPQLRITVTVYAESPQDRFVLMNGSRHVEGDEISPGMVLEEIRREGAVFSYRRYRFLVTQ